MSETQTTAQRIQQDISFYYGYGPTAPRLSPLAERIAAEIDALIRQRDFDRSASTALADQYSLLAAERNALKAEVAKLKPYAIVQIAKLKRDSAIEELDGAEDEEERRQCARDLGDWHEMAFRATNLMREQWERDRKTLVRVELGDMVKAACS